MEQTDENKTMLQVMLDNIENDNIWNDSGSYKLDNCPFEEVFPAMQAYATLATTAQQSIIDGQKERIEAVQNALAKTIGILQNVRHETDYMPDSYYEWIDKVIRETEEYLPEYE